MVTQVYIFAKTHQTTHLKIGGFYINSVSVKLFLKVNMVKASDRLSCTFEDELVTDHFQFCWMSRMCCHAKCLGTPHLTLYGCSLSE